MIGVSLIQRVLNNRKIYEFNKAKGEQHRSARTWLPQDVSRKFIETWASLEANIHEKQLNIGLKQMPTSETLSSSLSDESDIYLRCSEYVSVSDLAGLELEVEWGVDGKSWWTFTLSIFGLSVVDPCATFCIFAKHSN